MLDDCPYTRGLIKKQTLSIKHEYQLEPSTLPRGVLYKEPPCLCALFSLDYNSTTTVISPSVLDGWLDAISLLWLHRWSTVENTTRWMNYHSALIQREHDLYCRASVVQPLLTLSSDEYSWLIHHHRYTHTHRLPWHRMGMWLMFNSWVRNARRSNILDKVDFSHNKTA